MRRTTWIYLLLAAIAFGIYYYLNNRAVTPAEPVDFAITFEPEAEISYLFKEEDGAPIGIRIESSETGEVVELARNAENAWVLIKPVEAAANQGSVEAASSQLITIRIVDRLSTAIQPEDVGLDSPGYTLVVQFKGDVERIVEIGVITPTESGYYVRANDEIVIVSKAAIDSLTGLLTNPPYLETPTAPAGININATSTP